MSRQDDRPPATDAGDHPGIIWSHPAALDPQATDQLKLRLDFYATSIQLTAYDESGIPARQRTVSAHDIADVITANTRTHTGILPEGVLWRTLHPAGPPRTAIWVPPHKRRLALSVAYAEPARRFHIPLPGLVFICSPETPPTILAAKERPQSPDSHLYHAPLFNLFKDGGSCQGTHKYQPDITTMPEDFFRSWFTLHGDDQVRSKKHPHRLTDLWTELDGADEFPLDDLVYWGTVQAAAL